MKGRVWAAAVSLLSTWVLVASAQAAITTTSVTSPTDGTLLFQNLDTDPNQTVTISGTTDGSPGDLIDIGCYSGSLDYHDYEGPTNSGIAVNPGGSFSVDVPQSFFKSGTCNLVAVPHGSSKTSLPAGATGSRVTFSYFATYRGAGGTNDYTFNDVTLAASATSNSIDACGPYTTLVDGTSAMNVGPELFYCAGSFYNSSGDLGGGSDLTRSEIRIDGHNAYGSYSASHLFTGSDALPGVPVLSASLDSFNTSTRDAQTTESEPLVDCNGTNDYAPTSSNCTAFDATGVTITRVTQYTDDARVATVTDTFRSNDNSAHSLDLQYETDLNGSTAGWEFPGSTSFSQQSTGGTAPAASSAPETVYAIDDTGSAPSLTNPVGAMTFSTPYSGVTFDNTLWGGEQSGLFDFQELVPAGGSTAIIWSYATGTSLSQVQGYAADAQAAMQAALQTAVTITTPASGATVNSSPVTVTGTATAASGVQSVSVNGVRATTSGDTWSASVPLTSGSNRITATATSDDGSTASASTTVTYTPPTTTTPTPTPTEPQVTVAHRSFTGRKVLVELRCSSGGSACKGAVTLRYVVTVVKHHKKHRTLVTVASRRYVIAPGRSASVSASLNGRGKRLLKAHGKLLVRGTVTLVQTTGGTVTAASFTLTLKQPAKKRHG